ncbi:MAG: hypothetical protein AAB641_01375 [Patescibacteria group bacterium]
MNEEEKLIEEQLKKLPPSLQKAIEAVPWKSSIKEIALLNKLTLEQVPVVERETMFILYGFENPDDYIGNLMREAQISEDTAISIAEAVNERIIKAIALKVDEFDKPKATDNPPMVEKGEVAHDVASATSEVSSKKYEVREEGPKVAVPDYRYDGKDPYREPIV